MSEALAEQNPPETVGYVNVSARQLNTHEVQRWQSEIKASVYAAIGKESPELINWMMREYGVGRLQVWGLFSFDSERPRFVGALTTITNFYPPNRKVLLIYTLHAPKKITRHGMAAAFRSVLQFATETKCDGIEALSKHPGVIALCGELGFDVDERRMYKEV